MYRMYVGVFRGLDPDWILTRAEPNPLRALRNVGTVYLKVLTYQYRYGTALNKYL
jgi:hypothetical protein